MERTTRHRKVFLSYRSTDRAVVEEFAERLRRDGVDAWYDHWEIAPGDDILAMMDQGIDSYAVGLIFVSHAWSEGAWVQDEYTSLVLRKVEDGIQLVPVLLEDVGDRLPARLRKLARRPVADYEAIRDTLLGNRPKARRHYRATSTYPLGDRPARGRRNRSRDGVTAGRSPRSTRRGAHQPREWSRLATVPPGCGYVTSDLALDSDLTGRKWLC